MYRVGESGYDELLRSSGILKTDLVSADIMDINYTFNPVRKTSEGTWEEVETGTGYKIQENSNNSIIQSSVVAQSSVQGQKIPTPKVSKVRYGQLLRLLEKTGLAKEIVTDPKLIQQKLAEIADRETAAQFMSLWHGTKAVFDKFSTQFMSSGEGVQAYG
jgi:hypothetical protein